MSIKVENLSKFYGEQAAVNNISFEIHSGQVVGFLGPNGAGKSTTMKMITTYLTPNDGKIWVEGIDNQEDSLSVRKKIGYLPESNPLYLDMNVIDYLAYAAELEGVQKSEMKDAIKKVVDKCGLKEVQHKDISELSKGFKQRVGLAQAMIHDPQVLILDEPTSGLDPNQILEIRKLIKNLGKEKTLILSTHIMQEVQAVCDRVLIINKGEIVADGTPEDLQQKFKGETVINVKFKLNPSISKNAIIEELKRIRGVERVSVTAEDEKSYSFDVLSSSADDIAEDIAKAAGKLGLVTLGLNQEVMSLEDIFRELTSKN
ncbi:MAG: ATP-binding cassette domain-containing protein [Ignavibacteria bacterium]|nr:ATP-binding cassette domain-containing protein [Ignavibacteria bacterium]